MPGYQEKIELLKYEKASLKHQLNWFKQQLFVEKSEKPLIDNSDQLSLGEMLNDIDTQPEGEAETITYELRKKQRPAEDSVTNHEMRFNDSAPIELMNIIQMPSYSTDFMPVIDEEENLRVKQQPNLE